MTKSSAPTAPRKRGPQTTVEVRLPIEKQLPLPSAANFFHIAHSGLDVVLAVGQADITKMGIGSPDADDVVRVEADVTHRFMMSLGSFVQLRALIEEITTQFAAQGVKLPNAPFDQVTRK